MSREPDNGTTPLLDDKTLRLHQRNPTPERLLLAAFPAPEDVSFAERQEAEDLWLFESARAALEAALTLQRDGRFAIALHLGEAVETAAGVHPLDATSALARALAASATPGQLLLSESAFSALGDSLPEDAPWLHTLSWLAHGQYSFDGLGDPVGVVEVNATVGFQPSPPSQGGRLRRLPDEGLITGWRAAAGQRVPMRPGWRLLRRLGVGGSGEAWLGRHAETLERRVFKFCYHTSQLPTLKREVALFRLLQQDPQATPGILPLLDWQLDQPPHFIETPFVEGGDLRHWWHTRGGASAVPMSQRLEIAAQMADALAAAHAVGVLHKDIKPTNVLIDDSSGDPQAQLADFGVGAITDQLRARAAELTVAGGGSRSALFGAAAALGGTPLYMAPELFEGRPATVHADSYALGVVLYQLAVGDLGRALGNDGLQEIDSEVLRDDVAGLTARAPLKRRIDLTALADGLRRLPQREAERLQAARDAAAQARSRRMRRLLLPAFAAVLLLALVLAGMLQRISAEAERANLEAVRANAEALRANREAATAHEVTEFFLDLFDVAGPDQSRGEDVSVREVLDRGAERVDEELADQPVVRGRLLASIGEVYRKLGLFDTSSEIVERALAVQREGDVPVEDLVISLNRLGAIYADTGRLDDGEALLNESIALLEAKSMTDNDLYGGALSILGSIYNDQGNRELAGPLLERTVQWRRQHLPAGDSAIAVSLNNLGFHRLQSAEYASAESLFAESLEIRRSSLGEEHSETAISWSNLGTVYRIRGELARAAEAFEQATKIWSGSLGDAHAYTSVGWNNSAAVARLRGDYKQAISLSQRALNVRRASYGDDHLWVAVSLQELARSQSMLGRHEEALAHQREAQRIFAGKDGEASKNAATAAALLSDMLLAANQPEAALSESTRAVDALRALHRDAPDDARLTADFADALLEQGRALDRTDDAASAGERWREAQQMVAAADVGPSLLADQVLTTQVLTARLHALLGEISLARSLYRELQDKGYVDPLLDQALSAAVPSRQ